MIQELNENTVGRYLVTTQGSQHIWNIHDDSISYMRLPGPTSGAFGAGDNEVIELTRIDSWPVVGGSSFIWFDSPDNPVFEEQWRLSSRIVSIEELP